jgi:hypothetical protein
MNTPIMIMKKQPKEEKQTLVIQEIERVFQGNTYALGCRAFDIDERKEVKVLLNFDFKELLYVVATGETYEETLNKEETK